MRTGYQGPGAVSDWWPLPGHPASQARTLHFTPLGPWELRERKARNTLGRVKKIPLFFPALLTQTQHTGDSFKASPHTQVRQSIFKFTAGHRGPEVEGIYKQHGDWKGSPLVEHLNCVTAAALETVLQDTRHPAGGSL